MDMVELVYLVELLVGVRVSTNTLDRGLYGLPSLRTQVALLAHTLSWIKSSFFT